MRDCDMQKMIMHLHEEIDLLLGEGSKEAYMRLNKKLELIWSVLIKKDIGLYCMSMFCDIWRLEMVRGERTILDGVDSVGEAIRKYRNIRFALLRLENDFPIELCLEGIQYITDIELSNSAFQFLLPVIVEDSDKVIARISEITQEYVSEE